MYKYQNISSLSQAITADGDISPRVVSPGETVIADHPLENPNFKFVGEIDVPEEEQNNPKIVSVVADSPTKITDAQPVENKETN